MKRAVDLVGGGVALCLTAPMMTVSAVGIYVSMGRPIFFRQVRPGRDGELFELVKFRTMLPPQPGEDHVGNDAERLTRVGRLLRATSLDELPTLVNVVRGDMSLVGPRPLLVRYLDRYSPRQLRRHEVRPGVTGWAQVNGRNSLSWEDKLELDVWYVENQSLLVDIKILLQTVGKVLARDGISAEGEATMPEFMGTSGQAGADPLQHEPEAGCDRD
ncbi:MAG: hypothetical protein CL928_16960 [Deltaproteobacteria bacterium]|nr:hypothetical protein [Deltaproteobacteria bacterium]